MTCIICGEAVDQARRTPCCENAICETCYDGKLDHVVVTSATELPECFLCHASIEEATGWDAVLNRDDWERLQGQIDRIQSLAAPAGHAPPSDEQRRYAAWIGGSYVHGCGTAVGITDGCDVVQCPGCSQVVNITGGEPGAHTFHFQEFFQDLRGFGAASQRQALESLIASHRTAWDSLFLDDLIKTVEAGDPNDWLGNMSQEVWGHFLDFLRARVLPTGEQELEASDLTSLYKSVSAIPELNADAHVMYELYQVEDAAEFIMQRRRIEIIARIGDQRLADILRGKLSHSSWWV